MKAEFSATYPAGTDFYLFLDAARIVADHMGEDLPDTLGLDDLECLATERCVSMHTIMLEYQYFVKGELGWD
ncbi:MAG: hypothetical protein JTJ30_12740 [Catenibacterium mitsuokai]|nr:hypothetical protein [Catenibacterium mitsuokai]MBN2932833.1 hypothetical protein [Catenibacterium mitsuokai]